MATTAQTTLIQTRLKPRIKKEAEKVLDQYGMTLNDALRIFVHVVANTGTFPLNLNSYQPNAETQEVLLKVKKGKDLHKVKDVGTFFDSFKK